MDRGVYQILSGALAQEQRLYQITHNTANINTTGFKRADTIFGSVMAQSGASATRLRQGESPLRAASHLQPNSVPFVFAQVRGHHTDYSPGRLRSTGDPLHVALQGEGFFEVKTPEGLRYTRNGTFQLDAARRLVNRQGHPVMGTKGELKLPPGEVRIGNDGTIEVRRTGGQNAQARGRKIGTLNVVNIVHPAMIQSAGSSLFIGQSPTPVKNPSVAAGHVEDSNVNAVAEMAKLIEVSRIYESAQKLLQTFDHLAEVVISEVGNTA